MGSHSRGHDGGRSGRRAAVGVGGGRRDRLGRWWKGAAAAVGACLVVAGVQTAGRALDGGSTPAPVTGSGTWFSGLGSPYGGCGIPQNQLDSQDFVALNVFNTPGDYADYPRPLTGANAARKGMWDNGHNCGRWVKVSVADYCTGVNDGAPGQPFCRNGSWVADKYNGATLTMLVADSCGDANAWCRDDPYHLDLSHDSLNRFVLNGSPATGMDPAHWNNRHLSWQFVPAPNYSGDLRIGFLRGAQTYWGAIAVSHLPNGLHGVEYLSGGGWHVAAMNGDMGQSYVIQPSTVGGRQFTVRVRDAADALVNGGREYTFALPSSCASQCAADYTRVDYTTTDPAGQVPSGTPSTGTTTTDPAPTTADPGPTTSDASPTAADPTSPAPTGTVMTSGPTGTEPTATQSLTQQPTTDPTATQPTTEPPATAPTPQPPATGPVTEPPATQPPTSVPSTTGSPTGQPLPTRTTPGSTPPRSAPAATPTRTVPRGAPTRTTPPRRPAPPRCTAAVQVLASWPGGYLAAVNVTTSSAVKGWRVHWTAGRGQQVTTVWAGRVTIAGSGVTVGNTTYNGRLAKNGRTTFAFLATGRPSVTGLTCTAT